MAAIEIEWTPTFLNAVAFALETTLQRVSKDSLRDATLSESWRKAEEWCRNVKPFTDLSDDNAPLTDIPDIPAFPLTSQELRNLEAAIDRIARARGRVPHTLNQVSLSSSTLGWVLSVGVGCATIAAINIVLFHPGVASVFVIPGLAVPWIALCVWIGHHFHFLGQHKTTLEVAHI